MLLIGYFAAKIVGKLVYKATHRGRPRPPLQSGPGGSFISRVAAHPSKLVGAVVVWAIFLATPATPTDESGFADSRTRADTGGAAPDRVTPRRRGCYPPP